MSSIFTQIINRTIPGHFVYEDDICIGIMTIEPLQTGHVLVIPRQEINHWDDVPLDIASHLMDISQKISKALKRVYPCKRIGLSIIGIEVPHTHIHLCPINSIDDFNFSKAKGLNPSQDHLAQHAQKIKEQLTIILQQQ
jgi:histidine triad (HIT) family protein